MPIQEIIRLTTSGDEESNMSILLALHCAPIIRGVKMANILTVTMEEFSGIGFLLKGTAISYRFLKSRGDKAILYLYRENELREYLCSEDIRSFLHAYGYHGENLEGMLDRLSERILLHGCEKAEFPHEIGIFLGYPLMDVKGFLENDGKNFVYSGYWKVYHDVHGALRLFRKYDEEREHVVQEIILGKTIREIAV